MARVTALLTCVIMIGLALLVERVPKERMTDLSLIIASLFGGGVLGLYTIGLFTTRVGNAAVLIGLGVSVALNVYLMANSFGWLPAAATVKVHDYWVTVLVNLLLIGTAYAAALIIPKEPRDLAGLTVWTRKGVVVE